MNEDATIQAPPQGRFNSLADLRAAHADLLDRYHAAEDPAQALEGVDEFIHKGRATGVILDADKDRWAAQSLIDYWTTVLIRGGREAEAGLLASYDATLAPLLDERLCPFRGLEAFQEENQSFFYGRRQLTGELVARLGAGRLVCVLGPSGSGKSSLVRAGLIPRLKAGEVEGSRDWVYLPVLVPGANPLESLAAALQTGGARISGAELGGSPRALAGLLDRLYPGKTVLVTIDQFEEIFTLCTDPGMRRAFVAALLFLLDLEKPRHRLAITMRSDFNANLASLPELQAKVEDARVNILPLTAGELREVIEKPAQQVNLRIDEQVINELVVEVLGDPSALPLLQFTLLKLWENRDHNRVTLEIYRKIGGGRMALSKSAEDLYQSLSSEKQQTLKRILLQMVRPGEGVEVTSNRIQRKTLYQGGEDPERIDFVLDQLIKERLVRATGGTGPESSVEVAHEALIRNWSTLITWLETERVELRKRQRLSAVAQQWNAGHDAGLLLRGLALQEALRYEDLNPLEKDFVKASLNQENEEAAEREEQRNKALDAAQKLAAAEKQRAEVQAHAAAALRRRAVYLSIAMVVIAVVAVIAMISKIQADLSRTEAQQARGSAQTQEAKANSALVTADLSRVTAVSAQSTAEADRSAAVIAQSTAVVDRNKAYGAQQEAEKQAALARSREMAAQANNQLDANPALAQLLAVEAYHTGDTVEARSALLSSILAGQSGTLGPSIDFSALGDPLKSGSAFVRSVAINPAGTIAAVGDENGAVQLWDLSQRTPLGAGQPRVLGGKVLSIDFDPGGSTIAYGGASAELVIWDVNAGRAAGDPIQTNYWITKILYSPDGSKIAVATLGGKLWIYSVADQKMIQSIDPGRENRLWALAWDPKGGRLATAGSDKKIHILNASTYDEMTALAGHSDTILGLAWSPDGRSIYSGGTDDRLIQWNLETGEKAEVDGGQTVIEDLSLTSKGDILATAGGNGQVKVWDAASLKPVAVLEGHTQKVLGVAFDRSGSLLLSGGLDATARVWQGSRKESFGKLLFEVYGPPYGLLAGTGGKVLAATRISPFLIGPGEPDHSFDHRPSISAAAGNVGGTNVLISGEENGKILIYPEGNIPAPKIIDTGAAEVRALAVSAKGDRLAASVCKARSKPEDPCVETEIHLFSLPDLKEIGQAFNLGGTVVDSLAFNASADRLALGDDNGRITLWNLAERKTDGVTMNQPSQVLSLAYSPDGTTMAAGYQDGSILLWDVASRQPLGIPLSSSGESVTALTFRADGKTLVSGSQDGSLVEWDATPAAWAARACRSAQRNLSEVEWQQYVQTTPYQKVCPDNP